MINPTQNNMYCSAYQPLVSGNYLVGAVISKANVIRRNDVIKETPFSLDFLNYAKMDLKTKSKQQLNPKHEVLMDTTDKEIVNRTLGWHAAIAELVDAPVGDFTYTGPVRDLQGRLIHRFEAPFLPDSR